MSEPIDRRAFLRTTAAMGAAASAGTLARALGASAHAVGVDSIRVGVIGCGGRGTGAAINAMEAHPSTRICALADVFAGRIESSLGHLRETERFRDRIDVEPGRAYAGFDACERLLADGGLDYVILATPPHFRPMHLEGAVRAGVHVFMEKPAGVDPVGVRRVLAAADKADARGLSVVAGTQRRHEASYLAAMDRVRSGDIGDVLSARCYWNQGGLWVHRRRPEYSDMEWQLRNWLYFTWVSGDHIVEQHVHNLDVVSWALQAHPIRCAGMGGRQSRTGEEYGNVFDHFAVDYEYPGGVHVLSMCRQADGCATRVEEVLHGTRGTLTTRSGRAEINGVAPWRFSGSNPNPYVREHERLIHAIRSGDRVNEARALAESTLTAIMGRESAYTGQEITWEQAMASALDLSPPSYEFGPLVTRPVAIPGRTRFE